MGNLAINAMNIEGQVGTAAIVLAASNSQANGDFATELDRMLQGKTNPALTSAVSEPERTPGKGSSSINATSLSHEIASTLAEASPDKGLGAPSPTGAAPGEASSTLQSSRLAQAFVTGQHGSPYVAGSASERLDALIATGPSPLGKGSQSAPVEMLAPLQNVTTQYGPQDPSSGPTPKARASQNKDSKASSANQATPAEASSTLQPSHLAQAFGRGQDRPAYIAGSSSKQMDALDATSSSNLRKGSQSKAVETLPPSQHATTQLGLQDPSSGPSPKTEASQNKDSKPSSTSQARPDEANSTSQPSRLAQTFATGPHGPAYLAGSKPSSANQARLAEASSTSQPSRLAQAFATGPHGPAYLAGSTSERLDALNATGPSRLGKGSQSAPAETLAPSQNVTTQLGPQDRSGRMDALDATSPSRLAKGSQSEGVETIGPLQNLTAQLGPQDPSGGPNPKTEASQDKGAKTPSANQATPAEASSTLHQSETAEVVTSGQEGPALVTGSDPTPAPIATLQTTGQSSLTVDPLSPDFSLSMPFESTKAVPTGRVDEPPNSTRMKNSPQGNHAVSGSNSDAVPDVTSGSLVEGPAQTKDIDAAASIHDTKQTDASTYKKGGEAAPDLSKVADGRGGLTKTNADPPLAPQLTPQGRAESGRTSPEAVRASQGRGEADSASVLEGYQANPQTAVSSARLTQQAGNAEMQVRLRTEALGPIDVHTIVKGSDIGASIRVEGRDTQVMLANELSQLERALNERSLRVERLDVLQGSASGGQSNGSGPGNSYGSPSEPRPNYASHSAGQTYPSVPEAPTLLEDGTLGLSTMRINLRV